MSKYTSAPWKANIGLNQQHGEIRSKKYLIAFVDCRYGEIGEPEANAYLIAAAPELLEACQAALNLAKEMSEGDLYDQINSAIKKATGES